MSCEWVLCAEGLEQSPIDLADPTPAQLSKERIAALMFAMLLGLFELQAPASSGAAPLLTLPAGR